MSFALIRTTIRDSGTGALPFAIPEFGLGFQWTKQVKSINKCVDTACKGNKVQYRVNLIRDVDGIFCDYDY